MDLTRGLRSAMLSRSTLIHDSNGWRCRSYTRDRYARGAVATRSLYIETLELENFHVKFVCLTLGSHERLEIALTCRVQKRCILFREIGNFNAGQYIMV
jgi:hypothetical protein